MSKPSKLVVALVLIGFAATIAEAHRRPRRPHHHRTKADIVVGQPTPLRQAVVIDGRPHGVLDLNVKPKATEVWTNGRFRGACSAFDGYPGKLHLPPGVHRIKLVTPDGEEVTRDISDLFEIATDLGALEVIADIPADLAKKLAPGGRAFVQIAEAGPAPLNATIKQVTANQAVVEFTSPTPTIRPGMTAQVRFLN